MACRRSAPESGTAGAFDFAADATFFGVFVSEVVAAALGLFVAVFFGGVVGAALRGLVGGGGGAAGTSSAGSI